VQRELAGAGRRQRRPGPGRVQHEYSIIRRDDGTSQWAYKGKPLYFWAKDAKPGDRSGDGVNQVWHLARP